jgi:hypothetical protein
MPDYTPPRRVEARVVGLHRRDPAKLFAVNREDGEYYFVERGDSEDSEFFTFIHENISNNPGGYNVELITKGKNAILVVSQEYSELYHGNLVHVVDTDYSKAMVDPASIFSARNGRCGEFAKRVMEINPYLSYPFVCTKREHIGLYRGRDNTFNHPCISFNHEMPELEKALILDRLVLGEHDLLDGNGSVHLIINPVREVHDLTFQTLQRVYGRGIKRHEVNRLRRS